MEEKWRAMRSEGGGREGRREDLGWRRACSRGQSVRRRRQLACPSAPLWAAHHDHARARESELLSSCKTKRQEHRFRLEGC